MTDKPLTLDALMKAKELLGPPVPRVMVSHAVPRSKAYRLTLPYLGDTVLVSPADAKLEND
jgi:hypothetical protein